MEVVLQAGESLLEERLPKTVQRDVVLAMALAYVELSREAMAEAVPTVVRSCDLLETALKLLQEEGGSTLAPELQEQTEETLEELTPRCVLELLALPLNKENASQREGLQGLRSTLWAVGEGGAAALIRVRCSCYFFSVWPSTQHERVCLWCSKRTFGDYSICIQCCFVGIDAGQRSGREL